MLSKQPVFIIFLYEQRCYMAYLLIVMLFEYQTSKYLLVFVLFWIELLLGLWLKVNNLTSTLNKISFL